MEITYEKWNESKEELIRSILIDICEVKINNQYDYTYINELKNHKFFELTHSWLIWRMILFNKCTICNDYTDNNID